MANSKEDRYETISIESKIREGVFHKVVSLRAVIPHESICME